MPSRDPAAQGRVLLTGATGYVGGRLLRALEEQGRPVRCLARSPAHLASRVAPGTEVVRGDAVSGAGLLEALRGVDSAFYLIHSMGSSGAFEEEDRRAAIQFGAAARAAGVRRIVYLGALADESQPLSAHLRSRVEVGRLLRAAGVPVIELRASIVIGSGSLSFEMIRALVEHLPLLVLPRWTSMPAQPIGIDDLLAYLLAALDEDPTGSPVYEIGGSDRMSYADLMREYARQRGLRRWLLPVPVLTPWLSSLWLGLVTPLYARIGRKLIDSVRHPTVVRDAAARRAFAVLPSDIRTAMARALENEDREFAETRWSDALSVSGAAPSSFGGMRIGRRFVDSRALRVPVPTSRAFAPVRRIGGASGWYGNDWLWRLRGFLDLLAGGAGMRRGRRHPDLLAVGDTVDCWRVEAFEADRFLRLVGEMRLPGRAWLEFEVAPEGAGARIRQTAAFEPAGLAGLVYWYGIYPLHALVFGGMLRGLARAAIAGMALICVMASQASATEIEGVHFVERHQATGALLRLQGVGLLRYRVVFKGYVAALYLGEDVAPERALEDVPRRLEIAHFWSIPASALAQATRDALAWNTGPETLALLRDRIERFNALYEDVAPDDRYALTYVPGRGTELALNGEPLGVVEGADFSAALFAIWLGEKPLDAALRAQLLADR